MEELDKIQQLMGSISDGLTEDDSAELSREIVEFKPKEVASLGENEDLPIDYKYVRENVYNLIERNTDAVEELSHIAKDSGHPRAFEVLNGLMKTNLEMNAQLLSIQKEIRDIKGINEKNQPKTQVNIQQNTYEGSTKELLNKLKVETPKH